MAFSKLSQDLTKSLSLDDKKNNGIYFTPQNIVKLTIDNILDYKNSILTILEPSCGSCEFIQFIDNTFTNKSINCIELNKTIFDNIKDIKLINNKINLINTNYLDYNDDILYDLIIGNPPYYVMNKKNVDKKYSKYYEGRPNIFILFIIHSLNKLNDNGILSFILPKNFMNCLYYNKLRNYIYKNYKIINIIDCSDSNYIETQQDTIIFIIQNNKNIKDNINYILEKNNSIIFNTIENIIKLKELYEGSKSLNDLNFEVNVGNVIWNEVKSLLTDDDTKTRLIYSSDIKDNNLIKINYKNKLKKNYINKKGINDIVLVVNRGYGKGSYNFNYCLIDIDYEYLIENHLILIKYKDDIDIDELKKIYIKIINSFTNIKTNEFIKIYFGNNAINTTELQYILPIY
jgi:tRNA1(Val) A37 N6-methylase TrmN6